MDNQAPQSNFDSLKSAVLGATDIQSPTSPLGSFPELAKMYQSSFQLPQIKAAIGAQSQIADTQVQAQKAAAAAAKAKQDAMLDPSKYQKIPKSDGGYTFLAPNGQEISAQDFARVTDQSEADVLKNSENPMDQAFINDYKNLEDFLTNLRNGDTEKVNAAIQAQPELTNYTNDVPGLISAFKAHYPTVYGYTQGVNQPIDSSYIPNAEALLRNNAGGTATIGG